MSTVGEPQLRLELDALQLAALEALQEFAERIDVSPVDELSSREQGGLGWSMLTASASVVDPMLPSCPYAPAGFGIGNQFSTGTPPVLLLRCTHPVDDGGPHCWARSGDPTSC